MLDPQTQWKDLLVTIDEAEDISSPALSSLEKWIKATFLKEIDWDE